MIAVYISNKYFVKLILITIIILFVTIMMSLSSGMSRNELLIADIKLSTYSWNRMYQLSIDSQKLLLDRASKAHINSIYIDISEVIDIIESNDDNKLSKMNMSLNNTCLLAKDRDIKVNFLAGNNKWYKEDTRYIPSSILTFSEEYNLSSSCKIEELQLDIEFYTDKESELNTKEKTLYYLEMISEVIHTKNKLNSSIRLNFTIPFSFNNSEYFVTYNNNSASLYTHLNVLLNKSNTINYITVMAYRNYLDNGVDGLINIIDPYFNITKNFPYNRLYIALETDKVEPSKITFYNKSISDLYKVINELYLRYKDFDGVEGITIHTMDSYLKMIKE